MVELLQHENELLMTAKKISLDFAIQLLLSEFHLENVKADCNLERPKSNDIQHVKYRGVGVRELNQHMQGDVLIQFHLSHREYVSEEKFHLPFL